MVAWVNEWWNQVSGTVQHGIEITIVGMALVFFTLGLVILAMVLLTKLPWLRARKPSEETSQPTVSTLTPIPTTEPAADDDELARVAAIAVAMLRTRHTVHRRAPTRAAHSAWKSYGRAEQLGL